MLRNFKRSALAAMAAAATLFATAAPAEARDRYRDGRGDDAAIAIGAGIIGLAVGAAIASDRDDGYYRDRRYGRPYRGGYYYGAYPSYRSGYYRDYRRDYRGDYRRGRGYDRSYYRNHRRHYRY